MLTYSLWDDMVFDNFEVELINVFAAVFFSLFTLIIDLTLSPIEIITLIIWKIIKRKEK